MSHLESGERLIADPRAYLQLEAGFRRLLSRYPAVYRARREEEMLATLMESSAPGQRRPGPRDVLDLVLGAARAHLRLTVLPASSSAINAVALPAAALLAAYLMIPLISIAVNVLGGRSLGDDFRHFDSTVFHVIWIAVNVVPILAGIALAAAVIARRPALVRRVAAFALPVLVATPAVQGWPAAVAMDRHAASLAMLATLVVAAQPAALVQPRRRLAWLARVAVTVPVLTALIGLMGLVRLAYTNPQATSTPGVIVFSVPAFVLVIALVSMVVLIVRWNDRGALLASAMLAAAMLPKLASQLWPYEVRIQSIIAAVSVILGAIVLAALHRRAQARAAAPRRRAST